MEIQKINRSEYKEVVDLWEASVRATHHFLEEDDILFFKPLILNEYLDAVELRCTRDEKSEISGFSGVAGKNLEMLFIHPDHRGNGLGEKLLKNAIEEFEISHVDVNEANEQALKFYQKYGFKTYSRSEKDPTGRPYPILHMALDHKLL
ncbi:MAG: GNAT family N-acetyltransferase [Bacteroidota bacterium]